MIISIIVAMDEKRGIGFRNRLPWHLSADLVRFKKLTMKHTVIMGRKTYESIGKILPGRTMVVITRSENYHAASVFVVHSLAEAITVAKNHGDEEAFIIGGEAIFKMALPIAQRIYLTNVHTVIEADVFFPQFDESEWIVDQCIDVPADEKNQYPSTFSILNRIKKNIIKLG